MHIVKTNQIIYESIVWQKHPSSERYFFSVYNAKLILLRRNDFPDEPLFTYIDGLDIFDLEDKPESWLLS